MRVLYRLDAADPARFPTRWVHEVGRDHYRVDCPGKSSQVVKRSELDEYLKTSFSMHVTTTQPELDVGEFRPRIWRGEHNPVVVERDWAIAFGGLATLTRRMHELFRYVEPCSANLGAFGHESRQLLILAATEVESALRAVLLANGEEAPEKGHWTMHHYVKLRDPMRLREWKVALHGYPEFPAVAPFSTWDRNAPGKSLDWNNAYNSVKHDREREFAKATLAQAVAATAAAFVLFVAQFGEGDPRRVDGLGDFRVVERSEFPLAERYVPARIAGEDAQWTPVPLFS